MLKRKIRSCENRAAVAATKGEVLLGVRVTVVAGGREAEAGNGEGLAIGTARKCEGVEVGAVRPLRHRPRCKFLPHR